MEDFDREYYEQVKRMLDSSVTRKEAERIVRPDVISVYGTFQFFENGTEVGFCALRAESVFLAIKPEEIASVYDWPKMQQYLELIALEQGMEDL